MTPPPTRYAAEIFVRWQPLLTFTRRRLALLDWFERNAKILSFTDAPEHVGVEIGRRGQRIRMDRESLVLTFAGPDARLDEHVEDALDNLWSIVEPRRVEIFAYRGMWAAPLTEDYEGARAKLATRVIGSANSAHPWGPVDVACLADFETPAGAIQAEFGVVSAEELQARLALNQTGLIASRHSDAPQVHLAEDQLPPVAMFAEISAVPARPAVTASDIVEGGEQFEAIMSELVTLLAESL